MSDRPKRAREDPPQGRALAEWVSLGISALLLLGITAFLVYEGLREPPPFIPAEVRPLVEEARRVGGQYVLPIEVRNEGDRAFRSLEIEATYRGPDGREETQEMTLDYLGERSSEKLYLYMDQDPRATPVRTRAAHYQSN